ncbi:MAG: ketoacyl-ACP synthase III [Saprospiraceae bacterium]|nr:ketoacyl-ACP synthase III [Saprospiraceae bacterium]
MATINAKITAVGGYVPDYILTNAELETMVDTNDEWITTRTGIKERRILKGEGKGVSDMAVPVIQQLLEKSNSQPEEIDLVIFSTATPDYLFPASACIAAKKTNLVNAFGFDLLAACSSFLYALSTGAKYIQSGMYKKVIVIGADKMSSIIDYTDRATCIIFGDGAGGVLLEPTQDRTGLIDEWHRVDGVGEEFLLMPAGGSKHPASLETINARQHFAKQDGKNVFKYAVTNMANATLKVMERNGLTGDSLDWLVPHQANKRIIDYTAEQANLSKEKVMLNIQKYGNTTSATIPLCLWDYEKQLKKGDNLVLTAFGGGFTWGASYVKWAYDPN